MTVLGGRDRPGWYDQAACSEVDLAVMFPEPDEPADAAEAVCRACPVVQACSVHADAEFVAFGVWGGELRGA